MRWLLVAIIGISGFACTEHGKGGGVFCSFNGQVHQVGEQFPANDGCNFCECDVDGQVVCSTDPCSDGGLPDAQNSCAPTGNCGNGPQCGQFCCGVGEQCLNGTTCTCGGQQACSNGDTCQSGGPVGPPVGGGFCGSVCCGVTMGCPI